MDIKNLSPKEKLERACYVNANSEILEILAHDKDELIRYAVAANPNTSKETLEYLAKDEGYVVRNNVARNSNTSIEALKILALDENYDVRKVVVENSKAQEVLNSLFDKLSNTNFEEVTFTKIDDLRKADTLDAFNKIYEVLQTCKEDGIEIKQNSNEDDNKIHLGED